MPKKLGIDLNKVDFIVFSHYHWDHTKGLQQHKFKSKKKLILHPDILEKVSKEESEKLQNDFQIVIETKPLKFTNEVFYLGEIPRKTQFEKGTHKGDSMLDDSALAINCEDGVIVLTGCSHSGICNICEYAKEITGQSLYAVMGGFHLFEDDPIAVEGTIKYFKKEKPTYLYPMHCVDFPTMVRFYNEFGVEKLGAGDVIEFND